MNERVAICVCTYKRPKMLERCINSLIAQSNDGRLTPMIVVVDNDAERSAFPIVGHKSDHSPFPIYYEHQPKRGIAAARNSALDRAMELRTDWIAFLDDDEWAEPDWIMQLMNCDYHDTPVLYGLRIMHIPDPMPFWALPPVASKRAEGASMKTAFTHNVRFSADLVRAGLRFDEGLNLAGGEDTQFFTAAYKLGFKIRHTRRAVTNETHHPERLTYRAQIARAHWAAASTLRMHAAQLSRWMWWRKVLGVPVDFIVGAALTMIASVGLILGLPQCKAIALFGGKKIGKGAGKISALMGHSPQSYRNIAGS